MPTTRITQHAKERLLAIADDATKRHTETHAYLLGHYDKDGTGVITRVEQVGAPTEHAFMTRPDLVAAAQLLQPLRRKGYRILGEAHRHANIIGPSPGDLETLKRSDPKDFPDHRCLVVTTFNNEKEPVMKCHALTSDGTTQEHDLVLTDENDPLQYQPFLPGSVSDATVLLFGVGSGGGQVAVQAAMLNPGRLVLIDPDKVEERNLSRHVLGKRAVGKNKARAMREYLRERTTAKVFAFDFTVTPGKRERLGPLFLDSDLVVNCTGHPVASSILCAIGREHQVPIIHAGVYEQGAGGFVFYQDPHSSEPCYDCIFQHTRRARPEDNVTLESLTSTYGFTPEQLDHQLGLFADINVVAAIQAKVVMEALKGISFDKNLWLIDNHQLGINATLVRQDPDCITCHPNQ